MKPCALQLARGFAFPVRRFPRGASVTVHAELKNYWPIAFRKASSSSRRRAA
jgi:hypothetical protein